MRAGVLRERVYIQRKNRTPDGAGGFTEEWGTVGTARAKIRFDSGGEGLQAQQPTSTVTLTVEVRYRTDILPEMRLLWGTRVLEVIYSHDPSFRRERTEIKCREVGFNG